MYPNVRLTGATPALRQGVLQLTRAVLRLERAPPATSLDINFIGLDAMRRINEESRGLNTPTDVLTFSQSSKEETFMNELLFSSTTDGGVDDPSANGPCASAMRGELLSIGVVYVCVEYMWQRCYLRPTQNLPLVPYLAAALVHAELHALGYDHTTPAELREMVRREQFIGWQLHQQKRRFPATLPPLDPLEYLRDLQDRH